MRENVGGGEFRLLALRCLVRVRGECGDVDQPCDPVISSRRRDDASTVRVPDKNGRGDDPAQRAFYRGDVARECVEAVLGGDHLMPIRLKRGNHLVKARAVGPDPVAKHDARFGLRRFHFALLGCLSRTG